MKYKVTFKPIPEAIYHVEAKDEDTAWEKAEDRYLDEYLASPTVEEEP